MDRSSSLTTYCVMLPVVKFSALDPETWKSSLTIVPVGPLFGLQCLYPSGEVRPLVALTPYCARFFAHELGAAQLLTSNSISKTITLSCDVFYVVGSIEADGLLCLSN